VEDFHHGGHGDHGAVKSGAQRHSVFSVLSVSSVVKHFGSTLASWTKL
jgi:hypothetical protein